MEDVHSLSSSLKIRGRSQNRNGLIHHPLSDTQITLYPSLNVLAIGNLICLETGAVRLGPKDINLSLLPQRSSASLMSCKKIEGVKGRPMFGADVRRLVLFLLTYFAVMVVSWKEAVWNIREAGGSLYACQERGDWVHVSFDVGVDKIRVYTYSILRRTHNVSGDRAMSLCQRRPSGVCFQGRYVQPS